MVEIHDVVFYSDYEKLAAENAKLRDAGNAIKLAAERNFDWQYAPDFEKAFNELCEALGGEDDHYNG